MPTIITAAVVVLLRGIEQTCSRRRTMSGLRHSLAFRSTRGVSSLAFGFPSSNTSFLAVSSTWVGSAYKWPEIPLRITMCTHS